MAIQEDEAMALSAPDAIDVNLTFGYHVALATVFAFGLGSLVAQLLLLWARDQVQEEAVKVDRRLRLSGKLLLSSPELQDNFFKWMDQIPAVRWLPPLVFALEVGFTLKLTGKEECRWLPVFLRSPRWILAGVRVAMEMHGWSKRNQSLASMLNIVYFELLIPLMMALRNPCYGSLGPSYVSKAVAAGYSIALVIVCHLLTPCTMQDFPAVCWVMGLGNVASIYAQFLHHNGGLSFRSDPDFLGLFTTAIATMVTLLVVYCSRLTLTTFLLKKFLRGIYIRRHN